MPVNNNNVNFVRLSFIIINFIMFKNYGLVYLEDY